MMEIEKYLTRRKLKVLSPDTIELPKVTGADVEVLSYEELERLLAASKAAPAASCGVFAAITLIRLRSSM